MTENEFMLYDRLEVIRNTVAKYGENNFYLSFSGGKDSTLVHHLLDEALPNNKILRCFINTGIEYLDILKFVKDMALKDNRIIVYNAGINIRKMLENYGYPFKSKEHSHYVSVYQNSGETKSTKRYVLGGLNRSRFACPKVLQYQFSPLNNLKISDKCCAKLKKQTAHRFERERERTIAILGVRTSEGGARSQHKGCAVFDGNQLVKFKPINPCSDDWCKWYIETRNIQLCRLYYPPYNFERTGCKGCPFALKLQEELETMSKLLPNEAKQCEILWKPVYDEYRRLNYRLKSDEQTKLF